jgi:hypothetical protein
MPDNCHSSENGVNMRDYDFNYDMNDETLLHHNCLGGQDPN